MWQSGCGRSAINNSVLQRLIPAALRGGMTNSRVIRRKTVPRVSAWWDQGLTALSLFGLGGWRRSWWWCWRCRNSRRRRRRRGLKGTDGEGERQIDPSRSASTITPIRHYVPPGRTYTHAASRGHLTRALRYHVHVCVCVRARARANVTVAVHRNVSTLGFAPSRFLLLYPSLRAMILVQTITLLVTSVTSPNSRAIASPVCRSRSKIATLSVSFPRARCTRVASESRTCARAATDLARANGTRRGGSKRDAKARAATRRAAHHFPRLPKPPT